MWDSNPPLWDHPKTARIAISFREPPLSAGENYLSDCDLTIRVAFTKMATKTRVFNQLPSNLYMWFKLWNAMNVLNFVVVYKYTKKQYSIDFRGVLFQNTLYNISFDHNRTLPRAKTRPTMYHTWKSVEKWPTYEDANTQTDRHTDWKGI